MCVLFEEFINIKCLKLVNKIVKLGWRMDVVTLLLHICQPYNIYTSFKNTHTHTYSQTYTHTYTQRAHIYIRTYIVTTAALEETRARAPTRLYRDSRDTRPSQINQRQQIASTRASPLWRRRTTQLHQKPRSFCTAQAYIVSAEHAHSEHKYICI